MNEIEKIDGVSRASIMALENYIRELPQVEIEPKHYFAQGLYSRQIDIKAGTLLTGKAHKTGHINILAHGEIAVVTEDGVKHLKAPQVIVSQPGIKRVGYAITDCTWVTVHATETTDLVELEEELIEPNWLIEEGETKCLL